MTAERRQGRDGESSIYSIRKRKIHMRGRNLTSIIFPDTRSRSMIWTFTVLNPSVIRYVIMAVTFSSQYIVWLRRLSPASVSDSNVWSHKMLPSTNESVHSLCVVVPNCGQFILEDEGRGNTLPEALARPSVVGVHNIQLTP